MTQKLGTRFRRSLAAACGALCLAATAASAQVVFLSTQLRPIESAQKMRSEILKDFPGGAEFVTEQPPQLGVHIRAEQQAGKPVSSLIGALHGELQPLAADSLVPLDDVLEKLKDRGLNPGMVEAGKLGTAKQMFIPWMQATYIMVANKQALPFLPQGADINALTYDQLAQWGANIQAKTGKRMLGFPAGPTGLMHRFFEGYLYPSYTGGVVTTFKSPEAVAMWTSFRELWKGVNPNSTNYGFMQEPLLSGDVWVAFDHVARLIDALSRKPDDFVAFPAPKGPKGHAFMPVLAGLAVPKWAPDVAKSKELVKYMLQPEQQVATLMAGLMLLAMGIAQLGSVIKFIPGPVIAGFTTGIGVIIWTGQWKDFFGLHPAASGTHFHEKTWALIQAFPSLDVPTTAIGLGTLLAVVLGTRTFGHIPGLKRLPAPLFAMLLAVAVPIHLEEGRVPFYYPYLLAGFTLYVGFPVAAAVREPTPKRVQQAVKRCIFGLVILDAVLATAFVGWPGLLIGLLLLPAIWLGKWVYST